MAIIFVLLQISLCITLTMTQQPAPTHHTVNWLYRPNFFYYPQSDPLRTSLPPRPQPNQSNAVVRDDYKYTPGIGAHKVHLQQVSWSDAWATCRDEGGHLAIINSKAESELLVALFAKANIGVNGRAHVGFHDLYKKNEWVTIEGQSLAEAGFSEWHQGEPNYWGERERCGSIYTDDGKLNDHDCAVAKSEFVCELKMR